MPKTRTLASRQTAKASGSRSSKGSPLAMRSRNAPVMPRSASSDLACMADSRPLILSTTGPRPLITRSFLVPKTFLSRASNKIHLTFAAANQGKSGKRRGKVLRGPCKRNPQAQYASRRTSNARPARVIRNLNWGGSARIRRPMLDIKLIREQPDLVAEGLKKLGPTLTFPTSWFWT